jgi:hypothetical protein
VKVSVWNDGVGCGIEWAESAGTGESKKKKYGIEYGLGEYPGTHGKHKRQALCVVGALSPSLCLRSTIICTMTTQ